MSGSEGFRDEWIRFLDNIRMVAEQKGSYGGLPSREDEGYDGRNVQETLENLVEDLKKKPLVDNLEKHIEEVDQSMAEEADDLVWIEGEPTNWSTILTNELRMWNHAAKQIAEQDEAPPEDQLNNRLSQAKTVKDSIEKYISPGRILSKLLDALNELLSLIS